MRAGFVGRDRERKQLAEAAAAVVRHGMPRAVLVAGEPGAGKSRLLEEAAGAASFPHTVTVAGYEPERDVPLAAMSDLLRGLAVLPDEGTPVAELSDGGDSANPLNALRLFEVVHRATSNLRPLLILADDLQWTDASSLALLHYLLRAAQSSGSPLLLFAATRPSAAAATLAASLERAMQEPGAFTHIDLQPLDLPAGLALAGQLLPHASAAVARSLWESAGGNPFWMEDLASAPHEGARRSAATRLQDLGADAALVVAALAVAGRPLPFQEIARVQGWPAERAESALSEALSRGAVLESMGSARLAHDLIRAAALADVPSELARSLHDKIAAGILSDAGDDAVRLGRALEHVRSAGKDPLPLAIRIATSPRRRLLGEDGLASLATVMDENAGHGRAGALRAALGELATDMGEHAIALHCWEASARHESGTRAAFAWLWAAREAYRLGDRSRAEDLLALVPASDDEILGIERDATDASIGMWLAGDPARARAATTRAVDATRRAIARAGGVKATPDALARACRYALNVGFELATMERRPEEAGDLAQEIRAVSRNEVERLDAEMTISGHLRRTGRWRESEQAARRVWTEAHASALPEITMASGYRLATVLLALGRLDEAEEIATECDVLGERIGGLAWTTAWFHADWFGAAQHRGDWQVALHALRARAKEITSPHYRSGLITEAIRWEARFAGAASRERITGMIDECSADLAAAGCTRCKAEFAVTAAEAYARAGLADDAAGQIREWEEQHPDASPLLTMRVARTRALVDLLRGDVAEGIRGLERVVGLAGSLEMAIESLWARLDLAGVLPAAKAERGYREAAEEADRIGATTERRIAEQGLRKLGVRAWRRGAGSAGPSLTEREQQIANLVLSGASNPEIAATLFLSRKTIERHVSNILAKVGARNRTELAARLSGAGRNEGSPR